MEFSLLILTSLYFFLPAYVANMAPVLCRFIPWGNVSINEKYVGKNKTWRGVVVATVAGGVVFWIQKLAYLQGFTQWALIDYSDFSIMLGVLMGLGAIVGDLVASYYKRKAEIAPGEPWIGVDQVDFVFGGIILAAFVYVPPASVAAIILILSPVLHFVVNIIGYWIGLRKSWV